MTVIFNVAELTSLRWLDRVVQVVNLNYLRLISLLGMCLVITPCGWAQENTAAGEKWYADYAKNQYAIQMPYTPENAKALKDRVRRFHYRVIYVSNDNVNDAQTTLLQIGFFANAEEAKETLEISRFLFTQQTLVRVSRRQHQEIIKDLEGRSAGQRQYFVFAVDPEQENPFEKTTSALLAQAKKHYMEKRYDQAIRHYQLLANMADEKTAAWAKELLGLCYEKKLNYKQAIETYAQILDEYPEGQGRARVNQRLRALLTAEDEDKAAFRKSSYGKNGRRYNTRGVVSQYYRNLRRTVEDEETEELVSLLSTNFDARASGQWDAHELRGRVSGFSVNNILEGVEDDVRIQRAFLDYAHKATGINVLVGRLKDFDSGVMTSYDGINANYSLRKDIRLSFSAGIPVYFTPVFEDLDYAFYSAHLAWDVNENWKTSGYYIKQTLFDVTDREAIGLRTHYYQEDITASLNVDYDIAFAELNNLLTNASYKFNEKMNVSGTFGIQRSPFLTASNILVGQSDLDLEEYLERQQNRDNLLDDAFNRTALNQYFSLSYQYKISQEHKVIADFYQTTLSDIPPSALLLGDDLDEITEEPEDFSQQAYGLQLNSQNVFLKNDSTNIGVKFRSNDGSTSTRVFFNERLRFGRSLTISPKMAYLFSSFDNEREDQTQFRYALNVAYKPFKNTEINFEAGNEHFEVIEGEYSYTATYFFLGYRLAF